MMKWAWLGRGMLIQLGSMFRAALSVWMPGLLTIWKPQSTSICCQRCRRSRRAAVTSLKACLKARFKEGIKWKKKKIQGPVELQETRDAPALKRSQEVRPALFPGLLYFRALPGFQTTCRDMADGNQLQPSTTDASLNASAASRELEQLQVAGTEALHREDIRAHQLAFVLHTSPQSVKGEVYRTVSNKPTHCTEARKSQRTQRARAVRVEHVLPNDFFWGPGSVQLGSLSSSPPRAEQNETHAGYSHVLHLPAHGGKERRSWQEETQQTLTSQLRFCDPRHRGTSCEPRGTCRTKCSASF